MIRCSKPSLAAQVVEGQPGLNEISYGSLGRVLTQHAPRPGSVPSTAHTRHGDDALLISQHSGVRGRGTRSSRSPLVK